MMAVGILIPELIWNIDFFSYLLAGFSPVGIAEYMFDSQEPVYTRTLSASFHMVLPLMLLGLVWRWDYDRRAFKLQTLFGWAVFIITYLFTEPSKNINWVHGFG